jgi:excisionase family DNA binding protein
MTTAGTAHSLTLRSDDLDRRGDDELRELLTVDEAANFLKVTISWIYKHVRPESEDRLPVVRLGKYLRFDRRDLHAYIDAKRAASHRQRRRR